MGKKKPKKTKKVHSWILNMLGKASPHSRRDGPTISTGYSTTIPSKRKKKIQYLKTLWRYSNVVLIVGLTMDSINRIYYYMRFKKKKKTGKTLLYSHISRFQLRQLVKSFIVELKLWNSNHVYTKNQLYFDLIIKSNYHKVDAINWNSKTSKIYNDNNNPHTV